MSTKDLSDPLAHAGWSIELHKELFPDEGEKADYEWIPIVTARGCTIITSDKSMKSWYAEGGRVRQVIERCNAKIFFLRGMRGADQAEAILKAERGICRSVRKFRGTYLFARIHAVGNRFGEVQALHFGGETKTERRYGIAANRG
jgi:hypothetical protein